MTFQTQLKIVANSEKEEFNNQFLYNDYKNMIDWIVDFFSKQGIYTSWSQIVPDFRDPVHHL